MAMRDAPCACVADAQITQMKYRLAEGSGECFYYLGEELGLQRGCFYYLGESAGESGDTEVGGGVSSSGRYLRRGGGDASIWSPPSGLDPRQDALLPPELLHHPKLAATLSPLPSVQVWRMTGTPVAWTQWSCRPQSRHCT